MSLGQLFSTLHTCREKTELSSFALTLSALLTTKREVKIEASAIGFLTHLTPFNKYGKTGTSIWLQLIFTV